MRRAQILSLSGQGMKARQIAVSLGMHQEYVRHLIRTFNEGGFDALKSRKRPGRREKLSEEERSIVVEIATAPPQAFGRPFNRWSLRKLRHFLVEHHKMITPVCHTTIGPVLKKAGVSFQKTRTWKRSNDPHYKAKKNGSRRSTAKRRKAPQ